MYVHMTSILSVQNVAISCIFLAGLQGSWYIASYRNYRVLKYVPAKVRYVYIVTYILMYINVHVSLC